MRTADEMRKLSRRSVSRVLKQFDKAVAEAAERGTYKVDVCIGDAGCDAETAVEVVVAVKELGYDCEWQHFDDSRDGGYTRFTISWKED